MSKIYLAGRFSRRPELNSLARYLRDIYGHEIVSRWVRPGDDHVISTGPSKEADDSERRRFAVEDCEDLDAADWVISLMEQPRSDGRGGRHIEFGYALAQKKRLTILGPRETVFHHLDCVEHFENIDEFLDALSSEV